MLHCAYGIFHLSRPAVSRPPASSASYQVFSAISDLAVVPLYSYGCLSVRNSSDHWGTLLPNESLMNYFLPSLYYTLFAAAVLHLITLGNGLWLALKFRQISALPPDMNPLEDNLTSRHQKKLSVATTGTYMTENERRLSTPMDDYRRSGMSYEDVGRPPSIPFHATRSPRSSIGSTDFPPRQYQITPGNSPKHSPRNSATAEDLKRMSAPPSSSHSSIAPAPPPRSPWRASYASYTGVPNHDLSELPPPSPRGSGQVPPSPRGYGNYSSRPSTSHSTVQQKQQQQSAGNTPTSPTQNRPAKFTESWYATESLFNRTHARNRASKSSEAGAGTYEAIRRRFDLSDSDDSDSESDYANETATAYSIITPSAVAAEKPYDGGDLGSPRQGHHPNPLRSNPSLPSIASGSSSPTKASARTKTPFAHKSALSEIDLNDRRVSGGGAAGADITDEKTAGFALRKNSPSKRYTWAPTSALRDRQSSIQPEADFYSKPYGELRSGTPPVIVGSDRQVSSGNDYGDLSAGAGGGAAAKRYFSFGKRAVSGKIAEEGRGNNWQVGWAR